MRPRKCDGPNRITVVEQTQMEELTIRIPKGLWTDLEQAVIQQDRQFLTEVARSLGLPVAEVLRKCLGTGAPQKVAVLAGSPADDPAACPWWSRSEGGLWRPCARQRLSPTMSCEAHLHAKTGPDHCLGSDMTIATVAELQCGIYKDEIYWFSADDSTHVYREDGSIEPDLKFKFANFRGRRVCIPLKKPPG